MPDQITRVDYYMGAVPNKPGEGAKVLAALKAAGVNLVACLGYRKSAKIAEMILAVAENTPPLSKAVKAAGLKLGQKAKAFLLTGEDRVGALAEVADKMAAAGINLVSIHAVAGGEGRFGALIAVDPKDVKKAGKALGV